MKHSANQAATELGVTKGTLLKWILQEKVHVQRHTIGKKTYYEIDEKELKRLKGLMVKSPRKGRPLLSDQN